MAAASTEEVELHETASSVARGGPPRGVLEESDNARVETEKADPIAGEKPAKPSGGARDLQSSDIFMLVRQQQFDVVRTLLEANPKFWAAVDEDGHSLLHWAALVGNDDFVKTALKRGVDVDVRSNNKQTPLMWAVIRGHVSASRLLMDAGADMRSQDSLGATPMTIAMQHRRHECVLLLLKRYGDHERLLGDCDNNGCTACHWAAYKGDKTGLQLLSYFDADFTKRDHANMLPLHRAVMASQAAVVEFLVVDCKSDLNARNKEGNSCMDLAQKQNDAMMQGLLKRITKKVQGEDGDVESGNKVSPEDGGEGSEGSKEEPKDFATFVKKLTKDKSAHIAFPVFWLVCVSMAMFQYLMDFRRLSWAAAPLSSAMFELGVPLSLALFAYTSLIDPGKLPPAPRGRSGVEELMKVFDGQQANLPKGMTTADMSRLCTTTWILKGFRTKYCVETGACVQEFDHYCIWLNCAIGRENHRPFVLLSLVEFCTQLAHISLIWTLTNTLVPAPNWDGWIIGLVTGYPLLALIAGAHMLFAPWVFMLFLHQQRLIASNLTTNEMLNVQRYEHFWQTVDAGNGQMKKVFRNPFNKGSVLKNCLDFWWTRRRQDLGPTELASSATHGHGHSHGHSHSSPQSLPSAAEGGKCCDAHGQGDQGHSHDHGHA